MPQIIMREVESSWRNQEGACGVKTGSPCLIAPLPPGAPIGAAWRAAA